MKEGRFLWSAHRITGKQKAGKARNIKEKQLKNSRSTVSKQPVALRSSASAEFSFDFCIQNPDDRVPSGFFCFPTRIGHMRHRMTRERTFPNLFLEEYRMASSCNGCFGGLTFPDFVQQRCCNPCCKQTTGSVGGTSTTNPTCTCTCTCTQQSGTVAGTSTGCGCCRRCGCGSCGSVGGTSTSTSNSGCGCSRCSG